MVQKEQITFRFWGGIIADGGKAVLARAFSWWKGRHRPQKEGREEAVADARSSGEYGSRDVI